MFILDDFLSLDDYFYFNISANKMKAQGNEGYSGERFDEAGRCQGMELMSEK